MGGCRCTFRQCENSTASKPGMHFFHFPIRDWPRLEIWAINAGRLEFKELPLSKLKNKVVCQDHFENRMFMNYLQEGLVKTAVPRLDILEDGKTWNVETNEINEREEWIIPEKNESVETETTRMEIQFVDSEHEEFNITPVLSPPKILNKTNKKSTSAMALLATVNNEDHKQEAPAAPAPTAILRKVLVKRKPKPSADNSPKKSKVQLLSIHRLPVKSLPNSVQQRDSTAEEIPSMVMPSSSTDVTEETLAQAAPRTQSAPIEPPASPAVTIITDPAYHVKLDEATARIAEVKKLLTDVLNKPIPEPKVIEVPVPTPMPVPVHKCEPQSDESGSKMEKGPHMNKVQLFNGIKRYLNPTMVALLRMELFAGAPERQWKSDEKSLAVELVNLGENVYGHFLDEFRFRLPAKKDALKWKEDALDDEDDAS
ncbi:uncharacterized protein LOC134208075 [Armigeres subalbatus]|uniref:uncharacterized protein LOC134208075 n=1 Tax=Armigeres subalbatus TaxID=124917 RepID=UPI002ED022A0